MDKEKEEQGIREGSIGLKQLINKKKSLRRLALEASESIMLSERERGGIEEDFLQSFLIEDKKEREVGEEDRRWKNFALRARSEVRESLITERAIDRPV